MTGVRWEKSICPRDQGTRQLLTHVCSASLLGSLCVQVSSSSSKLAQTGIQSLAISGTGSLDVSYIQVAVWEIWVVILTGEAGRNFIQVLLWRSRWKGE